MHALLAILLAATSTPAAPAADGAQGNSQAQRPREERKICKRQEATESRLGSRRVCMTQAQWRALEGNGADEQLEGRQGVRSVG